MLQNLGYVGISAIDIDEWSVFASDLLGMQVAQDGKHSLALRLDDRQQRVFVDQGDTNTVSCMGWEVQDARKLEALAAHLSDHGIAVELGSQALAARRAVGGLITFKDPMGNRLEAYFGAERAASPFQPGRALSGFRTGAMGLGHIVLTTTSIDSILPFYRDVLGFRLSDYALRPFKAYFFHLNARHHSFAVVETGTNGFHHLMVELNSLDDVGQAYDKALVDDGRVGVTLGRHTNDLMTSFYANSPSGLMVEYGWGGREIDPGSWEPFECDYGPSLWGHERSWLSPEKREEARQLRFEAARQGRRAPVHVLPGYYEVDSGK